MKPPYIMSNDLKVYRMIFYLKEDQQLEANSKTHLFSSFGMIKKASALAGNGNVAVLGCGRCTEIPVQSLAQQFNRVDLVDIDENALNEVKAECGPWIKQKESIRFHSADLTGLIANIELNATQIVSKATNSLACLERLGMLLESSPPSFWSPPDQPRYDLVVCSIVLTQLQATVRESVERIYLRRFPENTSALSSYKPWCKSIWNFARKLEDTFVHHLGTLIHPSGKIFLSATVHVSWLTQVDNQNLATSGSWVATRTSRLADYLDTSVEIIEEKNWTWIRQESEGTYWGRLYGVQAIIYQKIPN